MLAWTAGINKGGYYYVKENINRDIYSSNVGFMR